MEKRTSLLIVGAGPFGLAMAAYARHLNIDHLLVGTPMAFWMAHMPAGMFLRSGSDWHLDPCEMHTIERFLESRGLTRTQLEPLSLDLYLAYAQWFQEQAQLDPLPLRVHTLNHTDGAPARFRADLTNGDTIAADRVILALGFQYFAHVPPDLGGRIPDRLFAHTCDLVDFRGLKDRRCLIIGGRQSAFEWAALVNEAGAASVDISHRHDSPRFAAADWSWVGPLVARFLEDPGWFRRLSPDGREAVNHRLWVEGRLKVEPWLEPRFQTDRIRVWPRTQIASTAVRPEGAIDVTFDTGHALVVDQIILATGYKADIGKVPFLVRGNLLDTMAIRDGYPVLDDTLQTTIPGLFITSLLAVNDFGPFFAFTVAARTSAQLMAGGLVN